MKNSDMPAMPQPMEKDKDGDILDASEYCSSNSGLTKREHFAGLAMQSLILAIPAWEALGYTCPSHSDTVTESYKYADLMTAELEKDNQP